MKYQYDLDLFKNEDDLSYYLLGAFMTDGCISIRKFTENAKRISLCSKDYNWILDIKNLICPEMKLIESNGSFNFTIHSTELADWFISKGCVPNKSLIMNFPSIPPQYLPDFIRGIIDGDGSIKMYSYIKKWKGKDHTCTSCDCYLCGASINFINGYCKSLEDNNIKYSLSTRLPVSSTLKDGRVITPTSNMYYVKILAQSKSDFLKWIYYDGHKLSMKRKFQTALSIIDYYSS